MAVSTGNLTLYKDLPLELREIVLSQCTPSTLASLSCTAKAVRDEAEPMLYDTISLHDSRWREMGSCVYTLSQVPSKAKLALTMMETEESSWSSSERQVYFAHLISHVEVMLTNATSLKVLSVWAPLEFDVTKIELAVRRQHFVLRRLYLSGLKDFLQLMRQQLQLEVLGLWNKSSDRIKKEDASAVRQILDYRQNPLASPAIPSHPYFPIVFGLKWEDIDRERLLFTFFAYPLYEEDEEDEREDKLYHEPEESDIEDAIDTARCVLEIETKNYVLGDILHKDLGRDLFDDPDNPPHQILHIILPDLSPDSFVKAEEMLALHLVFCRSGETLRLCTIAPIEPPLDLVSISPALTQLFRSVVASSFDGLEIVEVFRPEESSSEEQQEYEGWSLTTAERMLQILAEVNERRKAGHGIHRFGFARHDFRGAGGAYSRREDGTYPTTWHEHGYLW